MNEDFLTIIFTVEVMVSPALPLPLTSSVKFCVDTNKYPYPSDLRTSFTSEDNELALLSASTQIMQSPLKVRKFSVVTSSVLLCFARTLGCPLQVITSVLINGLQDEGSSPHLYKFSPYLSSNLTGHFFPVQGLVQDLNLN
jgi:hypothetical protein